MSKQQIGVVGMAVMGRNLALNIESRGYTVSIFNRSREKTEEVIAENPGKKLVPYYTVKDFVESLETPRRILLMVKAGAGTDAAIDSLKPYLGKGLRQFFVGEIQATFQQRIGFRNQLHITVFNTVVNHLHIVTCAIGTNIGNARFTIFSHGGDFGQDWRNQFISFLLPTRHNGRTFQRALFTTGNPRTDEVKAYSLLKGGLNLSNEELAQTFTEWNNGELSSYLIDITKDIFTKKDEDGNYLVDVILDEAANKGTGKWTSQSALDLGEPLSLITESVFARYISSLKDQRVAASKVLSGPQAQPAGNKAEFIEKVRRALYLGKIVSYAQGFSQLRAASEEYNWDLNYGEIAKIFRAGCIIRAQFLQKITDAYAENPQIANLLLAPYFKKIADDYQQALRDVVAYAVQNGIPVPTFSAAVAYYDSYRAAVLPANLIQAQRDYFGAHTYKRIDKEGVFHTEWLD